MRLPVLPLAARTAFMAALAVAAFPCALPAQDEAVRSAVAAVQSGDLPSAEKLLRTELRVHPADAAVLEVLAAVLDQEKKYGAADELYSRALAISPRSPGLLNNYGNHLLSTAKPKEAQAAFAKVLALEPGHPNAAVQMARFALEQKEPAKADRFLNRLPADVRARPDIVLLSLRTAYALNRNAEAAALLVRVAGAARDDAQLSFAAGLALSAAGQHEKAESFFARTLELQPDNFDALRDLGLAAFHAGHYARAQTALNQALDKQPENVDLLSDLAAVNLKLNHEDTSLELLVRARKLAPGRADVHLLLARTASELGYFADAVEAWDAYLKLQPDDDVGRRERAFAESAIGQDTDAALAALQNYANRHPEDPMGHYELGAAESASNTAQALQALNRALTLKPHFAAAHLARGLLLYRQNKPQLALADFEQAAHEEPRNPIILGRLGQTYSALNRLDDSVRVLRAADQIAPSNAGILLQLGRALAKAGEAEESASVFARYRPLAAARQDGTRRQAGLLDFLSLSPGEQLARYRAGVERTVEQSPDNADALVRYLGLLLAEGKAAEAVAVSRRLTAVRPGAPVIEDAAGQLLEADEYGAADDLLQSAVEHGLTTTELQIDSAIASGHLRGPRAALEALDKLESSEKMSGSSKAGDFQLARAEFLEESNQPVEAKQALEAALRSGPARPALFRSAALLFLAHDQVPQALKLLDQAVRVLPRDPRFPLMRALAHALGGQNTDAEFQDMQNRWPEWSTVWVEHAFVLVANGQPEKAQAALDTAASLGDASPAAGAAAREIAKQAKPSQSSSREQLRRALSFLFG